MIKQNKTITVWLASKSTEDQQKLLKMARSKSKSLRQKHREAEKNILIKTKEKLEATNRKKQEKEAAKKIHTSKLISAVKAHGGPCMTAADVQKVLAQYNTQGSKMEAIKNEVRYLKEILSIKDSRLVFLKKRVDVLAADLIAVLSSADNVGLARVDVAGPSTVETDQVMEGVNDTDDNVCDEVSNQCQRKRKRTTNSDKANQITAKKRKTNKQDSIFETFIFERQGVWIAVAYEQDFFIGMVIEVHSDISGLVQFLNRGYMDTYRWPGVDDVAIIQSKFVFLSDFEPITKNRCRTMTIPETD